LVGHLRRGRELSRGRVGPRFVFRPTNLPIPSRPFSPNPPTCAAAPPHCPHLWPPPPLLISSFPNSCRHTPNPSRPPPISSSQGAFRCRSDLRRVVQIFDCFRWREEGRKERGRTQGDFCVYLLFICAAIQLIRYGVCDWVEGLSRILGGGRTTVILAVFGFFRGELMGISLGIM
jgi:hypothetical protein